MNTQVTLIGNPFDPIRSRHVMPATPGQTVGEWIEANVAGSKYPFLRGVNGKWLYDDEWDTYEIQPGDVVGLIAVPQGGGGGGRKNPLATILTLALVVGTSAIGLGAAAATALGGVSGAGGLTVATPLLGAGSLTPFGAAVASTVNAVVVAGGSFLINLALPPSTPKAPDAPSPTYSITSRGNQARLGATQEVQYGRVLRFPSLAAQPYREFSDDGIDDITGEAVLGTQILYELYMLGWGSYDVESYHVLGEDVANFGSQVEIFKYEPGEAVTAFPTNVITSESVDGLEFKFLDQLADGTYDDVIVHSGRMTASGASTATRHYIEDSSAAFGTTDSLIGKSLRIMVPSGLVSGGYYAETVCIAANTDKRIYWDAPAGWFLNGKIPAVGGPYLVAADANGDAVVNTTYDYAVVEHHNWVGTSDGYSVNTSTALPLVDEIGVDIVMPEGHWFQSGTPPNEGVDLGWRYEYREFNDSGEAIGPWKSLFDYDPAKLWANIPSLAAFGSPFGAENVIVAGKNEKPVRLSRRATVSSGRFKVRARSTVYSGINRGYGDAREPLLHASSVWGGLRGYANASGITWPGRTIIAVRTKADSNVNSSTLQQFSVLCTRKLQDYVGGGAGGLVDDGTLAAAPFSTTSGSATVRVTAPEGLISSLLDGALLTWSGASAVGGIPAAVLNGEFPIRLTSDVSMEFDAAYALASAPVTTTLDSGAIRLTVPTALSSALSIGGSVSISGAIAVGALAADKINGTRTITDKGSGWIEFAMPSFAVGANPFYAKKNAATVGFKLPAGLAALMVENARTRVTISGAGTVGTIPSGQINANVDLIRASATTIKTMFGITVSPGDVWGYFTVATAPTSNVTAAGGSSVSVQLLSSQTMSGGGTDVVVSVLASSTATGGGSSVAYAVGEWTQLQPSRRISSAIIDAATDTDYGAKLPIARLDLERLKRLELTWDRRDRYEEDGETWKAAPVKDRFDFCFDNRMPFFDAMNLVARCGRSHVVWPAGILTVIRDEPRELATAMYTPRNMLPKSLEVNYMFPTDDTPDHLVVEFFNEDFWDWDEVVAGPLSPGDPGFPGNVAGRIRFPGITNAQHAWREGRYEFGSTKYRRRTISFSTDVEGHIPFYGDLIEISHDIGNWGQWGYLIGYDVGDETATLRLSEPVDWGTEPITSTSHVIQLKDGLGRPSLAGLAYCQPGERDDEVIIDGSFVEEDVEIHVVDRYLREATTYSFGLADRNRLQALVTGIRPHGRSTVDVECYAYRVAGVYDADNDLDYVPPDQTDHLDRETAGPAVSRIDALLVVSAGKDAATIRANWSTAPWARYYIVETSVDDGVTWTRRGRTEETSFEFPVTDKSYTETVVETGFTAPASDLFRTLASETLMARNESTEGDAWPEGFYNGMVLRWTSGAYSGQRLQIRRNRAVRYLGYTEKKDALFLADILKPLPTAETDTYDILSIDAVTLKVAVRAVNRLEGPRATTEVSLAPMNTAAVGARLNADGSMSGYRVLGEDNARQTEVATRVDLYRFDADGNLFLRGKLYSENVAPDTYAVYVGEPLALVTGTTDTVELPKAPRGGDALMILVDGLALTQVESSPAAGEFSVAGTTVTLGTEPDPDSLIRLVMVADSTTGDLAGLHVAEACTFIPSATTATLPFTPMDGDELLVTLDGVPLVQVDSGPSAGEYAVSGTTITVASGLAADAVLLATGVDSVASETARRFRIVQWASDVLPITPVFPTEVAVVADGLVRTWASAPLEGEFSLGGSPALNLTWPGSTVAAGDVKIAIAMTSGDPVAPPYSYLTALGSISQAFSTTTSVTVTHNFGAFPVVNVIDDSGAVLVPLSITHTSVDQFTVSFLSSTSGTVVASLGGGVTEAVTIVEATTSHTLGESEYFLNYTGAAATLTLPAVDGLTIRPRILKNSGTGNLTVTPDGSETIDGAASFKLSPLRSITLWPTSGGWLVT